MTRLALVTGSQPFAGLPDSPSELLLSRIDGTTFNGIIVRAISTRVSLAEVPGNMARLVREHQPAFLVSLGLAPGEPVLRCEKTAINLLDFGVADNFGMRPTDGRRIDPAGPAARMATWDAAGLVSRIRAAGIPARVSHHAGTHLCNATLYAALGAMEQENPGAPCGFFHVPYLPHQVARFMSHAPAGGDTAPLTNRVLPSMSLADQLAGLTIVLDHLSAICSGET
jgi:pyroglutamyl-peptidase